MSHLALSAYVNDFLRNHVSANISHCTHLPQHSEQLTFHNHRIVLQSLPADTSAPKFAYVFFVFDADDNEWMRVSSGILPIADDKVQEISEKTLLK